MASYTHDPILNYNANLLKQAGTEQYTSGRDTTQQGVQATGDLLKSSGDFQPIIDQFRRLLSGDTTALMQEEQPQADVIGQQFSQVRRMISDQPRGGGKTSQVAQLPVQQIGQISNLLANARNSAPAGLQSALAAKAGVTSDAAQKLLGTGLSETGAGIGAAGSSANIAMGGRAQDINQQQHSFFTQIKTQLAQALI
jgi:hypothetical protein